MSREQRDFLALVDDHGATLLAMLRRLCGNASDADDVFQETALRVWRNFGTRPLLRNPRGWLMTIGYRAFLDHRERRHRHDPLVDPVDHRSQPPEAQAERSEWSERLNVAVGELPADIRQVIILHYTGGLTLRETAAALGISLGTVKSRLNAALNKLALNKLRSVLE
jgi:RNA polymerase sigma-70 factor (ECF subfamily)